MRATTESGRIILHPEIEIERVVIQKAQNWDDLVDSIMEKTLENGDADSTQVEIEEYYKAKKYDKIKKAVVELLGAEEFRDSDIVFDFVDRVRRKVDAR